MTRTRTRDNTGWAVEALRRWLDGQNSALDEWLEAGAVPSEASEVRNRGGVWTDAPLGGD